jgi:hypothetical protein
VHPEREHDRLRSYGLVDESGLEFVRVVELSE